MPDPAQSRQQPQHRIGIGESLPAVQHQQRDRIVRVQPVLQQQTPAGAGLHRREPEACVAIVPQQELHPAVAEHARAIEHQDRTRRCH